MSFVFASLLRTRTTNLSLPRFRPTKPKKKFDSPSRHPSFELDLSISNAVAELGRESSRSNGRNHRSRRRVGGHDAVRSSRVRSRAGTGEVEGVSVGDLSVGEDVGGESWDDVKGVVLDEGVGIVVGRPIELAVSEG